METTGDQRAYWNEVANKKTFKHKLDWNWIEMYLAPDARVLDYGCGYGRLTRELFLRGYKNVLGIDFSEMMLERARSENPQLDFRLLDGEDLVLSPASYDLIILFTVLTCIPSTSAQKELVTQCGKLLKPSGLLYISDLLLNNDDRNIKRYQNSTDSVYGTFQLLEGVKLRHHSPDYLQNELLKNYEIVCEKKFIVTTMNGNKSRAYQVLARLNA